MRPTIFLTFIINKIIFFKLIGVILANQGSTCSFHFRNKNDPQTVSENDQIHRLFFFSSCQWKIVKRMFRVVVSSFYMTNNTVSYSNYLLCLCHECKKSKWCYYFMLHTPSTYVMLTNYIEEGVTTHAYVIKIKLYNTFKNPHSNHSYHH